MILFLRQNFAEYPEIDRFLCGDHRLQLSADSLALGMIRKGRRIVNMDKMKMLNQDCQGGGNFVKNLLCSLNTIYNDKKCRNKNKSNENTEVRSNLSFA